MIKEYCKEIEYYQTNIKLSGILLPLANAIRRGLLSILPIISFDDRDNDSIDVIENTTVLTDDFIAHRIALLPINMNNQNLKVATSFDIEEGVRNFFFKNKEELPVFFFKNDGKGELDTTFFFLKGGHEEIPVTGYFNEETPITITKCNEEDKVLIECKPKIGIGRQNARSCPVGTVGFKIEGEEEGKRIFEIKVESIGFLSADQLILDTFEMLRVILGDISSSILISKKGDVNLFPKVKIDNKDGAFHFILKNENHTIGNLLSSYLQYFFKDELQFVSYRVNHPLVEEVEIILFSNLDDKSSTIENCTIFKSLEIDKKSLKGKSKDELEKLYIVIKFLEGIQKVRDLLGDLSKEFKKLTGLKSTSFEIK